MSCRAAATAADDDEHDERKKEFFFHIFTDSLGNFTHGTVIRFENLNYL